MMLPGFRLAAIRVPVLAAILATLAACAAPMDEPSYPALRFNSQPPLRLNVAQVNVTQSYVSSNAEPHVEQLFPDPPAKAAAQWAHDRLQPAGANGTLTYEIIDASVLDAKLPRSSGLSSLTTVDQTDRYDLSLTIRVSAVSGDNLQRASADVTVTRSQTINEKTTEAQRNGVWYDMTKQAMDELDAKLTAQINEHLAWFRQTMN